MKKIMVLGAGLYQVPLIKKIKEMGHQALVVSPSGAYPGIDLADVFIESDTRDKDRVLSAAKKYNIDAILTTGTDVAVPTIGYVIDELKLIGTGLLAANKSMDKALMKKCFVKYGVNTARFETIESYGQLVEIAEVIGYPLMVKATDSSGSRGITKVIHEDELLNAYNSAFNVTNSEYIIVEQFLDGYEIGSDTIILENEVAHVFLHGKQVSEPPVSTPIGHSMPLNISEELERKIYTLLKTASKALKINNTLSNADIMIVDDEPYIIEMGARLGATCIPEVISTFTGLNLYEYMIELSLGNQPKLTLPFKNQANAAVLIKTDTSGIVKKVTVPEETKNHPNLIDLALDIKVGSRVNAFTIGPDRIGQIIVKGENAEKAIRLAEKLAQTVIVELYE
ncbi:ATP-grasp domain-containing protein [Vibrio hibernica]|uniref:ATP-grasp domain-containing protein n=1 Tax=Vibrio hibernica TaxID=2587465 RepID=UPI0039AF24BA